MRKIGIFGGTFDPIHFGHLHLALSLQEKEGLDFVFFSSNYESPDLSKPSPKASALQRFEMMQLALEGVPGCKALDYEMKRKGPSYTIDLVLYIKSFLCTEKDQLFLLIAEELLESLPSWKESAKLLSLVTPLVGSRGGFEEESSSSIFGSKKFEIPKLEISSTFVRDRLKKKLYCGHLVPAKVLDYIYLNKLY
jgi:nicotinate-nucleotide adenylyltransferase